MGIAGVSGGLKPNTAPCDKFATPLFLCACTWLCGAVNLSRNPNLAGNPAEAAAYRVRLTRARQPYPFTPVNTMPWMKYRWAKKKTTIIGTTATTAAAIVRCH